MSMYVGRFFFSFFRFSRSVPFLLLLLLFTFEICLPQGMGGDLSHVALADNVFLIVYDCRSMVVPRRETRFRSMLRRRILRIAQRRRARFITMSARMGRRRFLLCRFRWGGGGVVDKTGMWNSTKHGKYI